jgi:Ras GTPase-activating protein 3
MEEVQKRFPFEPEARYIGVSGFLFLRFVGAAILGPKLFDIMEDHPDPKALRSLTAVSKIIVKISGMVKTEVKGCC